MSFRRKAIPNRLARPGEDLDPPLVAQRRLAGRAVPSDNAQERAVSRMGAELIEETRCVYHSQVPPDVEGVKDVQGAGQYYRVGPDHSILSAPQHVGNVPPLSRLAFLGMQMRGAVAPTWSSRRCLRTPSSTSSSTKAPATCVCSSSISAFCLYGVGCFHCRYCGSRGSLGTLGAPFKLQTGAGGLAFLEWGSAPVPVSEI